MFPLHLVRVGHAASIEASSASRLASTVPGAPRPARRSMMASSSEAAVRAHGREVEHAGGAGELVHEGLEFVRHEGAVGAVAQSVAEGGERRGVAAQALGEIVAGRGQPDDSMWRRTVSASFTG